MFNDVDSDVNYYKKMCEVFKTAKKNYETNKKAELAARKEREAAIAAGLITEEKE